MVFKIGKLFSDSLYGFERIKTSSSSSSQSSSLSTKDALLTILLSVIVGNIWMWFGVVVGGNSLFDWKTLLFYPTRTRRRWRRNGRRRWGYKGNIILPILISWYQNQYQRGEEMVDEMVEERVVGFHSSPLPHPKSEFWFLIINDFDYQLCLIFIIFVMLCMCVYSGGIWWGCPPPSHLPTIYSTNISCYHLIQNQHLPPPLPLLLTQIPIIHHLFLHPLPPINHHLNLPLLLLSLLLLLLRGGWDGFKLGLFLC